MDETVPDGASNNPGWLGVNTDRRTACKLITEIKLNKKDSS